LGTSYYGKGKRQRSEHALKEKGARPTHIKGGLLLKKGKVGNLLVRVEGGGGSPSQKHSGGFVLGWGKKGPVWVRSGMESVMRGGFLWARVCQQKEVDR